MKERIPTILLILVVAIVWYVFVGQKWDHSVRRYPTPDTSAPNVVNPERTADLEAAVEAEAAVEPDEAEPSSPQK